ncbi:haloacid dehalogenase [Agromyces rhizosphaerae]|uniref:Haloacid dehalogenase n=1 Tax=Agromyces rhizosphaerae TaxID=88374 RepID=A0A9W6FQC3_9MICO|nr:HAD family phosphatase [Agromyces rhizosphaerae]GLI28919.1 haloacid dehalogenase [Agromyces rhizosphaerae]
MNQALPAAVLWDMDGTLVDTEPYWIRAETALVESYGGTWTHEDGLQLVGSGLWDSARILQRYGVDLPADRIVHGLTDEVRALLATEGVPWQPGARELLQAVRERGIRTALVTMSIRSMADDVVAAMGFEAFDAVVSGDEVEHPKPHPDPYLRGAELLEVPIGRCLAIEDSPTGLASAMGAGAVTLGVPHILPLDDAPADARWASLDGRTVDDLAAVFAAARTGEHA